MRNTWKKTAAFLLAFTLAAVPLSQTGVKGGLFGNIGIVAHAETTVTTFDELVAAVGDDGSGGLITLGADIVQDEGNFYVKKDATLDLNGHTLSVGEATITVDSAFTIKDSVGNGKYVSADSSYNILIRFNVPFTLESGTLEFTNSDSSGVDVWRGPFIMNGGTINSAGKSIWRDGGPVTINGGTINGGFDEDSGSMTINGGIFDFDVSSYVAAGTEIEKVGDFWGVGAKSIAELKVISITDATVNLGADNSVASITVGDDTITDLSGFDITYGVSDTDHTATAVPTDAGTYYAYVTAKDTNTSYTGTAKSASFDVAAAPTISSASVTLNDGFGLNFYVDNITDAADYTVMFDGACDENGTQVALTEKDGKFFATANVNAKDFKENIAATLYKDGVATDVTLTSSVDAYLTALLATDGLDDKTKAMVTSAQLYGLAADEYFNGTDNNVAARIAAYMTAANISDTAMNMALTPYAPTFTSDDAKVSMVLNSKIKLRVYSDNGASENGFGKYSEEAGLTPLTLAQPQAIDGFTVSGYTWVYRVLNNTASEAKDVNMAKALFAYMTAAKNLAVVDVASVTLDQSALTLTAGGNTATLTATVLPENATDKTVTWSSDNEAVATVDADGKVTAVAAGTANITATANDGSGVTATCAVTVTPAAITVTWNNNDITGTWGSSFTKDGVTITAENIDFEDKNFMEGGTFTTTLGNFTKIEVTTASFEASGTGWSGSTWTGNASSVSFSGNIMGCGFGNTKFVFTIEPKN